MAHQEKFFGIGHPDITAAFQRICGIRRVAGRSSTHERVISQGGSSSHHAATNGTTVVNGYAGGSKSRSDSSKVDSSSVKSFSNGCESVKKAAGKNGHNKDIRKRLEQNSNNYSSIRPSDESLANHKLPSEKNGCNGDSKKLCNGTASNDTHCSKDAKNVAMSNGHSNHVTTEESPCQEYSIDNYLLYYIFSFGASLGNEVFYILFFSYSLWNLDSFVARKMLIFWCTVMYIGQAAKDVIRWPRPDSPPVVRLEKRYELEYGMPSTHAMVGVAIPFGMLIFMLDRYEFNLILGILFCINWSILVSFSRLYLGMHSALDILAGLVSAILLMAMALPFVDYLDTFLMSHPYAVPCLVGAGVSLCLLYPPLDQWSTARGDTTLCIAVFSGIYAGLWLTRSQTTDVTPEVDTLPYILQFPDSNALLLSLAREAVGVFFLVILLTVSKFVMLRGMCKVSGLDPHDPESKQHLIVELPYKYVSYFLVSFTATYLMPLLFIHLDIQRPSFYTETFIDSVQ